MGCDCRLSNCQINTGGLRFLSGFSLHLSKGHPVDVHAAVGTETIYVDDFTGCIRTV